MSIAVAESNVHPAELHILISKIWKASSFDLRQFA